MSTIATSLEDTVIPLSLETRCMFNSTAPVTQLNRDVLENIFMQNTCLDLLYPHHASQTTRRTSQVCRRWRKFTLEYPMLWAASIDFADPLRWIEETISRSGSAPITDIILPSLTAHLMSREYGMFIRTSVQNARHSIPELIFLLASSNIQDKNLELGMSIIHRPQRVIIKIRKPKWDYVASNLSQPSPNLKFFSLALQGSQQIDENYILPEDLFGNQAPSLRVLELRGCSCHFESPLFQNLTTLVVRKPSSHNIPTVALWLKILRNMRDLQTLELNRCFATDNAVKFQSSTNTDTLQMVSLPKLESLTLLGSLSPCSTIFTHLRLPASCTMAVKCYRTRLSDDFLAMISLVQERLESMPQDTGRAGISIQCSQTGLGFNKRHMEPSRMDEIIFSFDWFASSGIMAILPSIIPSLKGAAAHVPELRLDFNSKALNDARTVDLLCGFAQVEHLRMIMEDTLLRVLSVMKSSLSPGVEGDAGLLLPELKSISLEHVLFGEHTAPNPEGLLSFLRGRPKITSVSFVNCTSISNTVAKLEALGIICSESPKSRTITPDI